MERTTGRRRGRVGNVAPEDDPVAPRRIRVRARDRGQQRLGVGMPRADVEGFRTGRLHNLPEIHHGHPVAEVLHDGEVVGDEEVGEVELFLQVLQER
ncbi:hypothetical protein HEB94_005519 [Actinopolymorpha pittospori]|uniref:Uncharacterized protein n=1 Tax=Actinopolymorpha pittospori TaxID=648752 RepID=A0A927RKX6_9ACTN|nr:hypothetical protein [Actinopolymorpha pittospori]